MSRYDIKGCLQKLEPFVFKITYSSSTYPKVRSKDVVLLLLGRCLLLFPLFCVCFLCLVLLAEEERADFLTLIILLMSCDC